MEPLQSNNQLPPCIGKLGAGDVVCSGTNCLPECRILGLSCRLRKFAARQDIFVQGDVQNQVYLVTAGAVRLYKVLCNGRRQIMGFKGPSDLLCFDRTPRHGFGAQTMTATELRVFPIGPFYAAAASDPRFLLKLYSEAAAELSRAHELALTIGQRGAEGSIAAFLLDADRRAAKASAEYDYVWLPMRGDIADYLGLTTETVSRILSSFKKKGLVELRGRRGMRLLNRTAVLNLATGSAEDLGRRVMQERLH
jgi:CRP/FNR family transcriptional regulator